MAHNKTYRALPHLAKPTQYGGLHFHSRAEAKWAIVFTTLGIPYLYEPRKFRLPSGKGYRPDFYLPDMGCYVEVKPQNLEDTRFQELGRLTSQRVFVVSSDLPYIPQDKDRVLLYTALAQKIWRKWPAEAGRSFALVREGSGRFNFVPLRTGMSCDPADPAILTAYIQASSYRF